MRNVSPTSEPSTPLTVSPGTCSSSHRVPASLRRRVNQRHQPRRQHADAARQAAASRASGVAARARRGVRADWSCWAFLMAKTQCPPTHGNATGVALHHTPGRPSVARPGCASARRPCGPLRSVTVPCWPGSDRHKAIATADPPPGRSAPSSPQACQPRNQRLRLTGNLALAHDQPRSSATRTLALSKDTSIPASYFMVVLP